MKLIEAEKAKDVIHEYFKSLMVNGASGTDVDRLAVGIGSCLKHDANLLKAIDELPSAEPDTTTHDSIPTETGKNDDYGTSGDCINRQANCEYCHEDSDGYVLSIEKNGHAYIQNGKLALRANGWWGECSINYCPMCGRKLRGDRDETN